MTSSRLTLTPLALALGLAGCAIGPDYFRPAAPLPAAYPEADAAAAPAAVDARWWQLFQDDTLNRLVEQALARNADLRQAIARVEQAEAVAREAGATLFPQIDLGAGSTQTQASTRSATYFAGQPQLRRSRTASLSTAYELDVWGRVRRADEAARAQLLGSTYARDAIRLSVAALVSQQYLGLRALDTQLALTEANLRSRQESLRLVETRVAAGLSSPIEAHQAQTLLAATQAQQAAQRKQRALIAHQLALLTGTPALAVGSGELGSLPLPPQPPAGLPADLIEARPDIRQAEQALIAANAGIGLAKAGYYPKFTLTGSLGSESRTLSDLFSGGASTWSLGIGLLMPLLDFGRTSARVDQAKAVTESSRIAWENALQTAYKEVRDALVSLREEGEAENAQRTRVEQATQTLKLARLRHEAGQVGFLEVLDAERTLNDAQQAQVATRQARLGAAVELFKALGGGWKRDAGGA